MEPADTLFMKLIRAARALVWLGLLAVLGIDAGNYTRLISLEMSAPQQAAFSASMAVEVIIAYAAARALDALLRLGYDAASARALRAGRRPAGPADPTAPSA